MKRTRSSLGHPYQRKTIAPSCPPPSASSPIDLLPLDLLQLILALIPCRPRTLVCSYISKRWRAAALRTLSSFTLRHELLRWRSLSGLLPALTDLTIMGEFSLRGVTLPSTLRALRVVGVERCICELFKPLQRLSLLSLELLWPCACWHKVIARNSSVLESLALATPTHDLPQHFHRELATLVLPRLRRLRLSMPLDDLTKEQPFFFTGQQALLDRHLSQLVSLTLLNIDRYSWDEDAQQLALNGSMTNLHEIYLWNVHEPPYLDAVLTRAPNLSSLAVSTPLPDNLVPYLPRIETLLTNLRLDMEMAQLELPRFTQCRRLHTLDCICENHDLDAYWPIAHQLVHFSGGAGKIDALSRYTALQSLKLRLGAVDTTSYHCLPPSLTSVSLNQDSDSEGVASFKKVLSACRKLVRFRTKAFDAPTRSLLCDAAEHAGLVRITFIHLHEDEVVKLRKQHPWLEVCVENEFGHEKYLPPF